MKSILVIVVLLIISCKNSAIKETNITRNNLDIDSSFLHSRPTDSLMAEISFSMQQFRDSLKGKNKIKFARLILKEFALCNCLFQGLKSDTSFLKLDQSNGYMALNEIIHSKEAIDSIEYVIKRYISWIDEPSDRSTNAKNYSILCLGLYESKFLDSIVKKLDKYIYTSEKH